MSIVNAQPFRVPLVDPRTGLITPPWTRYFLQVFERIGGTEGQTNTELVQDQFADAGIEEMRQDVYRVRDELYQHPPPTQSSEYQDQAPPGAFFLPEENTNARIEALEALLAVVVSEIDALKQDRP